jgi:hypothetical protein
LYVCLGEYVGPYRADVFIRYSRARFKREVDEMSFRIYMTDSVHYMSTGKSLSKRWYDILHPSTPKEDVDPETIISDVVSRAGLVVK